MQKVFTDVKSSRHVVYLGYEQSSTWQIFLHSNPVDESASSSNLNMIMGHDVITIMHSELEGMLCSSISFHGENPEAYFRTYTGQFRKEEHYSLNNFWEISHYDSLFQGKPFETRRSHIILRHFNSGRVLCAENNSSLHLEKVLTDIGSQKSDPVVLTVEPIQIGQAKLYSNQSYKIMMHHRPDLLLSHSKEYLSLKSMENNVKTAELEKEMMFTPLEDSYFDEKRVKAIFHGSTEQEEGCHFNFVDPTTQRDMLFVRSCMSEIIKLAHIYRLNFKTLMNSQRLVEVEGLLGNILCFLFDIEYTEDFDPKQINTSQILPKQSRQKIIKDLNLIEALMELIHYPYKNKVYTLEKVPKSIYAAQIIQLCYTTIRYGIMEYRPNELYASQWLNLLIEYSLSGLDDSLGAKSTLTELIDNNERILDAQIKKSTIDKFVLNLIESKGDHKYIDILRAICICSGKPMTKNQMIISTILLRDDSNKKRILPEMKIDNVDRKVAIKLPWISATTALVSTPIVANTTPNPPKASAASGSGLPSKANNIINEWTNLNQLYQETFGIDEGRYYAFYTSLISLLADLCMDRNYTAIDVLQLYLPLAICTEIVTSDLYDFNLRSAFCRLTTNLWVDVHPFMPVKFPDNVKLWTGADTPTVEAAANLTADITTKYEQLKVFILGLMQKFKMNTERPGHLHEGSSANIQVGSKKDLRNASGRSIGELGQGSGLKGERDLRQSSLGEIPQNVNAASFDDKIPLRADFFEFLLATIVMTKKMMLLGFFTEPRSFVTIFDALVEVLIVTDTAIAKIQSAGEKASGKRRKDTWQDDMFSDSASMSGEFSGEFSHERDSEEDVMFEGEDQLEGQQIEDEDISDLPDMELCIKIKNNVCAFLKLFAEIKTDQRACKLIRLVRKELQAPDIGQKGPSHSKTVQDVSRDLANMDDPDNSKLQGDRLADDELVRKNPSLGKDGIITSGIFEKLFEQVIDTGYDRLIVKNNFLVSLLIKQSLYENDELKALALDLLYTLYSEVICLGNRLNEIQLIEEESQIKALKDCQEIAKTLFHLNEKKETWFSVRENSQLISLKHQLRQVEGLLRGTAALEQSEKNTHIDAADSTLKVLMEHPFLKCNLERTFENIQGFSQDLMRNSQIIHYLCKILIYAVNNDIKGQNFSKYQSIVFLINHILSQVVKNNPENKQIVVKEVGKLIIELLLADSANSNAIILLNQIIKDYRPILEDQSMRDKILEQIYGSIVKESKKMMRTAYYLYTAQQFAMINQVTIRGNQSHLITNLISNQMNSVFSYIRQSTLLVNLRRDVKQPFLEIRLEEKKILLLREELCFFIACLEYVTLCSFDKNTFAEKIAQSLISFSDIAAIFRITGKPALLEYELCKFLYHVYLDTEVDHMIGSETETLEIASCLMEVILRCLPKDKLSDPDLANSFFLTHKELVSQSEAMVDLTRCAADTLQRLLDRIRKKSFQRTDQSRVASVIKTFHDQLVKKEALINSSPIHKESLASLISFLEGYSKKPTDKKSDSVEDTKGGSDSKSVHPKDPAPLKKDTESKRSRIQKALGFVIPDTELEMRKQQLGTIFRRVSLNQGLFSAAGGNNTLSSESRSFKRLCEEYLQSASYEYLASHELKKMIAPEDTPDFGNSSAGALSGLTAQSQYIRRENGVLSVSASYEQFFKSLVEFMNPANKAADDTIKIGLKIFKEFAEQSIGGDPESSDPKDQKIGMIEIRLDSNPGDKRRKQRRRRNRETRDRNVKSMSSQEFLVSIGIVELICNLILHKDSPVILSLCIRVACMILHEGNKQAQTEFFRVFSSDPNSSRILKRIEKLLLENFDSISKLMINHNADQMRKIFFGENSFAIYHFRGFHETMENLTQILKFFQLLCEGHNSDLQNFLRDQNLKEHGIATDADGIGVMSMFNQDSIDFIAQATLMFGSFVKFFNRECYQAGIAIVDFLIEALQGPCKGNQDRVIRCKIIDFCKDFINDLNSNSQDLKSRGFKMDNPSDRETLNNLFNKTIKLLLSILEFNYDRSVILSISKSISFEFLIDRLTILYVDYARKLKCKPRDTSLIMKVPDQLFKGEIKLGFNIFIFLSMVMDTVSDAYSDKVAELKGDQEIAFRFFKTNTGQIEISFNGAVHKVYFMKHPACNYLDLAFQEQVMNEVRRETPNEKISDFLDAAPRLFNQIDHTFEMTKKFIKPVFLAYIREGTLWFSFLFNGMMFIFLDKTVRNNESLDLQTDWFDQTYQIMGWVHLGAGILMTLLHFILKSKLVIVDNWREYINEYSKELHRSNRSETSSDNHLRNLMSKDVMSLTSTEMKYIIRDQRMRDGCVSPVETLVYHTKNLLFFFSDPTLIYFLLFVLFSSLANFYEVKFYYCFSLFDVIVSSVSPRPVSTL